MQFDNKVAIITGGAQGIGFEISLKLAENGAVAVIADVVEEKAKKASAELIAKGFKSDYLTVDVSNFSQVSEKFKKVLDKYGHINILINNAGITRDKLLLRMEEEDWDKVKK